jgi:hypothetical protein
MSEIAARRIEICSRPRKQRLPVTVEPPDDAIGATLIPEAIDHGARANEG